jgi:2-polyprenyl-3-methyl-5-hydroxy-6-metoxy-1,4-benzoquinol methylase
MKHKNMDNEFEHKKTTVDYSKPSPYSRPIKKGILKSIKSLRTYLKFRHRIKFIFNEYNIQNRSLKFLILDIGCGSGEFVEILSQKLPSSSIIGLEYDKRLICEAKYRCHKIKFIKASAEELPFDSNSIDIITSFHNVEHLYNPDNFISEAHRCLRVGGYLLLATPNKSGLPARILKHKWHAKKATDHVSLKTAETWRKLFESAKFDCVSHRTTVLSHLPLLKFTPFEIINIFLLVIFNDFPWNYGDSYHAIFKKK